MFSERTEQTSRSSACVCKPATLMAAGCETTAGRQSRTDCYQYREANRS